MNSILEMYNSRPVMTIFVAGVAVLLASELAYEAYILLVGRKRAKRPRKRGQVGMEGDTTGLNVRKPADLWNTVLFFPDYTPDRQGSATRQLQHYFRSARMSIHMCMYLVSHPGMGEIIRNKFEEGILIQIVTDWDTYTAHNNCGVKHWRRTGIQVRMKATGFLMHHKFAVIDEEALLTGSLNWTKQGMSCNQENVMVTTDKRIVDKYMDEFNTLWQLFGSEEDS